MSYGMIQLNDYSSKITEIQQSSCPNAPTVAPISVTGVSKNSYFTKNVDFDFLDLWSS